MQQVYWIISKKDAYFLTFYVTPEHLFERDIWDQPSKRPNLADYNIDIRTADGMAMHEAKPSSFMLSM